MRPLSFVAVVLTVSTGCIPFPKGLDPEDDDFLRHADDYVLFSLDPGPDNPDAPERFHKHVVLGKHVMPPGKDRDWLTANIDRGLVTKPENLTNRLGTRHGLQARRGKQSIEMVFDYATYTVTIHRGDQNVVRSTSELPMSLIEKTLFDAGVPLHGVKRREEQKAK